MRHETSYAYKQRMLNLCLLLQKSCGESRLPVSPTAIQIHQVSFAVINTYLTLTVNIQSHIPCNLAVLNWRLHAVTELNNAMPLLHRSINMG